jgi:hypothetical protein
MLVRQLKRFLCPTFWKTIVIVLLPGSRIYTLCKPLVDDTRLSLGSNYNCYLFLRASCHALGTNRVEISSSGRLGLSQTSLIHFAIIYYWLHNTYYLYYTVLDDLWLFSMLELEYFNECLSYIAPQKLKLKLNYDRQSVGHSVLVSGTHLGPVTNFSFSLKFSLGSCGFVIL